MPIHHVLLVLRRVLFCPVLRHIFFFLSVAFFLLNQLLAQLSFYTLVLITVAVVRIVESGMEIKCPNTLICEEAGGVNEVVPFLPFMNLQYKIYLLLEVLVTRSFGLDRNIAY